MIAHVRPGGVRRLLALGRVRPGRGELELPARAEAARREAVRHRVGPGVQQQQERLVAGNRVVWLDARAGGLRYSRTALELEVDLSDRTLTARRGDDVVRRLTVGVGAFDSPTPTGRFAVTDKLAGPSFSAAYGCCILALSAIQTSLPRGWTGGNRIAIHGTLSPSDFGHAVSAGCVHAPDADLRWLMRVAPLGTPVVIRP